jgi:hypothetical protein
MREHYKWKSRDCFVNQKKVFRVMCTILAERCTTLLLSAKDFLTYQQSVRDVIYGKIRGFLVLGYGLRVLRNNTIVPLCLLQQRLQKLSLRGHSFGEQHKSYSVVIGLHIRKALDIFGDRGRG